GPGLPMIPPLYQQAGWLAPTIVIIAVAFLSGVASLFICEVLASIRGNEKFQAQVEITTVAQLLLGKKYHYFFQVILYIALQAVNIASIVISSQTMDNLIITLFKGTCGLNIYPGGWICVDQGTSQSGSPFSESDYFIFTMGYLLTMVMVMPLGFFDLVDNMGVMIASLITMAVVTIQWVVAFCQEGLKTELMPATGPSAGMVLGIIIFNFSYVTTVPTWVNSINPDVSIHKCITWSIIITTAIYIVLGVFGGMAYPMSVSDNILTLLSNESTVASKVTTYLFPICALVTSIPVYVIVIRCNLLRGGLCGRRWAVFWSNLLPWIISIPLMNKNWMNAIQNWISLFFQSSTNYILPFVLYFVSRKFQASV
ncbi:hypothetical protein BDB00DRAFT_889615, partial [Zychaea mexicana]|uniref:uncharacterized protein n=1 Tax=Zychaea mexicana TaxID=64656 RepID=UPI0022FED194